VASSTKELKRLDNVERLDEWLGKLEYVAVEPAVEMILKFVLEVGS